MPSDVINRLTKEFYFSKGKRFFRNLVNVTRRSQKWLGRAVQGRSQQVRNVFQELAHEHLVH